MTDELERRREECLQLRAMLAESSITTHAIAKESYGGIDDIVNEDNELAMAYRTQKELNRFVILRLSLFWFHQVSLSIKTTCITAPVEDKLVNLFIKTTVWLLVVIWVLVLV